MAHMFESGMFVRKEAWHKLGTVIDHVPTTDEAYEVSGLNWNVVKAQNYCFFNNEQIKADSFSIIRDKDNKVLGTCGDRYELFQNHEAFNWCRPLAESELWHFETAGSLKEGKVCWILMNQGEIELVNQDKLKQYLLFTWSHDGSKAIQVMPTTIRVVCNNTLQVALSDAKICSKIRHTLNMTPKLEEVRKMYSEVKQSFTKQEDAFKFLLDKQVTDADIEAYVDSIMKNVFGADIQNMKDGREKTINTDIKNLLLDSAVNGSGNKEFGIDHTMYGVFNGVEEGIEHFVGRDRVKDRGYNILFGEGGKRVQGAFDEAMKIAAMV